MRIHPIWLLILFLPITCTRHSTPLSSYFPLLPAADTLHFAIEDPEARLTADTVPNALFFGAMPAEVIEKLAHAADTAESVVLARGRFALDAQYELYWADIRWVWFQHQCLLLHDKAQQRFTDHLTVAEWYGGDGGQILTGAWLTGLPRHGNLQIIQRQDAHSMRMVNDSIAENLEQAVSLWRLEGSAFVPEHVPDRRAWIQRFALPNMWTNE